MIEGRERISLKSSRGTKRFVRNLNCHKSVRAKKLFLKIVYVCAKCEFQIIFVWGQVSSNLVLKSIPCLNQPG